MPRAPPSGAVASHKALATTICRVTTFEPVVPNLPNSTRAFTNKYTTGSLAPPQQSQILAALSQLPLPRPVAQGNVINPLALYDATRANRGLSPLTPRQSAAALRTLATGRPATPPRRQGLFRSALGNLRALVTSVPKLPFMLYDEARQIPDLPANVQKAVSSSDNPLEAIGNAASVPGLRMLPGAFVAEQLLGEQGQGLEGLRANPLFTALDVLPLASGAAKTTKVARTARDAYAGQVEALTAARAAKGFDPSTAIVPSRPRPLQVALTRRLDPTGAVVPNAFGRGLARASDAITSTTPGNLLQQTFRERISSRTFNRGDTFLREAADPALPTETLRPPVPGGTDAMRLELTIRDQATDIQRRLADEGILPNSPESVEFYTRATTSRLPDGTPLPPEQMLDLPLSQRALMREVRDFQAATARYTDALPGPNRTKTLTIEGRPETFDLRTAQRIQRAQNVETSAREIAEARSFADGTARATPADMDVRIAAVESRRALGEIPSRTANDLIRLYELGKEAASRSDIARVIPTLRPLVREYPRVTRLVDHLQKSRWGEANVELRALANTRYGRTLPFDLADLQGEVSRLIARDRVLARTSHINDKYLARATKFREKVEARNPSPRWDELTQSAAREATRNRIREQFSADPDLDTLIQLADEGIYDTLAARDPRFERYVREDQAAARASWKALRDAGHDPIFFSRVTPQQAARQPYMRLADHPTTLQSTRARMMDATPYVKDVGIIVNQAQLDILQRRATAAALDDISTSFGRDRASLVDEYTPRLLARGDSPIPARARLDKMIRERWVPFSEVQKNVNKGQSAAFSIERASDIYIPRAMAENIRRMYEPSLPKLTAALDPITKAFRTSVLPLALRWQVNNLIGGAIVTAVNDPRAFIEMPAVIRQLWGERRVHPAASQRLMSEGAPPAGFGSMSPEMKRWDVDAASPLKDRVAASAQFASGTTLRRLYDSARESRISRLPEGFRKNVERMYGANQFVDDMYRASLGQSQMKRLLGKGYSRGAADALTAQSIRRAFQAWDDMTPMERSVMRGVVPFYGFAAYATKFALRYPFDHPFRASVLNSIARAELSDAMTGLPEYIREMILLGDPRANGIVKALNVGPFNPFGGVPSMFTVAGFTGQLNPAITTVLESIGVDVQRGGPQLFPELRYDPESGRLVADPGGNLVTNLVGNTIPQLSGIAALLGFNDKFNDTLARDPGAAGRMLLSNFGMPILTRNVNVGEQLIRAEMARFEDQENARKEALTSGNLGVLGDFPGLAAYGEQIRALQAGGQLDQLRPEVGSPGARSGAGLAYAAQAGLTGG